MYLSKYSCDDEDGKLKLREDVLRFLDESGQLQSLQREGMLYRENFLQRWENRREYGPPFRFTVLVNVLVLTEVSVTLGSLLLENPTQAEALFKDVVHCSLVTLCELPIITPDRVEALLRVDAIPAIPNLTLTEPACTHPITRGLQLLQGVLVALSAPAKYTRSAEFHCDRLACPGSVARRVRSLRPAPRCGFCGGALEERQRDRDLGDQVFALLLDPDVLRQPLGQRERSRGRVKHPVVLRLADDLCHGLELGRRYDVVVRPGYRWLEAWGVRPWINGAQRRVQAGLPSSPLPAEVQRLWMRTSADSPESPWAFAVTLASQLGAGRYPRHAYLHLKFGLLISLASQGLEKPPVSVLALGEDPAGSVLLWESLRLSERGVSVTGPSLSGAATGSSNVSCGGRGPAAGVTSELDADSWLSAGPLILATGGVCLLGCWDKWGKSSAAGLVKAALESGRSTLLTRGVPGSSWTAAGPSVPLKCAMWTYWSPSNKPSNLALLKTLIDTFGVPSLSYCGCDEAVVSQYLLHDAMNQHQQTDRDSIPECQFVEFLTIVNAQPVSLSEQASQLIQDYFVASRRARSDCLPVSALSTMVTMAEALARLSLRREATWADVVVVVWLYEVSMNTVFGPPPICPIPQDSSEPLKAGHLTQQMDNRLQNMKEWLENFNKSVLLSSLSVAKN